MSVIGFYFEKQVFLSPLQPEEAAAALQAALDKPDPVLLADDFSGRRIRLRNPEKKVLVPMARLRGKAEKGRFLVRPGKSLFGPIVSGVFSPSGTGCRVDVYTRSSFRTLVLACAWAAALLLFLIRHTPGHTPAETVAGKVAMALFLVSGFFVLFERGIFDGPEARAAGNFIRRALRGK